MTIRTYAAAAAIAVFGIVILCVFPGIVTWLPDLVMGPV
jgi:hypothetical protein